MTNNNSTLHFLHIFKFTKVCTFQSVLKIPNDSKYYLGNCFKTEQAVQFKKKPNTRKFLTT